MADVKLRSYIDKYGEVAGSRLYRAVQSRAGYIGATVRLRQALADRDADPDRVKKTARPADQPMLFDVSGLDDEASGPVGVGSSPFEAVAC